MKEEEPFSVRTVMTSDQWTRSVTIAEPFTSLPNGLETIITFAAETEKSTFLCSQLTSESEPPHRLILKQGAIVMLIRNLNAKGGLVNGTRLRIEEVRQHCLVCTIDQAGQVEFIPQINLTSLKTELPFDFSRKQFPVRLAFAITITKAQGQTFQHVDVYLEKPVFIHGMLYLPFSRVTKQQNLKIKMEDGTWFTENVYPEVLTN